MQQENSINKYVFGFFIILLGAFLFSGLNEFFSAFLGSLIFYILFKKLMYKLTRKLNKPLSATVIILISFVIVVLPLGIIIGMIYNRINIFSQNPEELKQYVDAAIARVDSLPIKIETKNFVDKTISFISIHIGGVLNSSLNVLASLSMMYFFLYFFLINENVLEEKIEYYIPVKKSTLLIFGKELVNQTYSNAIGVPIICIAQGIIMYIGYRIVGFPDATLLATLTGFASVIPLIGTAIIWIPVALFLLIDGDIWQGVFILLYSGIVVGTVDNLIRMVVSKKVGDVHPIVTVLGVIIGLKYFGLPGLVFGPLIISYFILFIKLFVKKYFKDEETIENIATSKINTNMVSNLVKRIIIAFYPTKK